MQESLFWGGGGKNVGQQLSEVLPGLFRALTGFSGSLYVIYFLVQF